MKEIKFKFEDLKVYQKSLEFIDVVYDTCNNFPNKEQYRLTSQFIRAANSIALNIAEGSGDTNPQFCRFLRITLGSIRESVVCSTIAKNQNYVSSEENQLLRKKLAELSKMTTGLIKYLKDNQSQ